MGNHDRLSEPFILNDRWLFDPTQDRLVDLQGLMECTVLKPVAARVLRILAHSPKILLSRRHLLDEGWRSFGFEVCENSLNQVMCALRTKFQELDPNEIYIKTIPRIGYCLMASVQPVSDGYRPAGARDNFTMALRQPTDTGQDDANDGDSGDSKVANVHQRGSYRAQSDAIGPSIVTYTGRTINLLDPHAELIDLADIAHALAHQCRFNGHTRAFYSVADHSIRVATQLPAPLRLAGLLHDACKAYLGSAIQPLKQLLPGFCALEQALWIAIAERFGLPSELPAAVLFADRVLLATERRDLIMKTGEAWATPDTVAPLEDTIHPLTSEEAEDIFLRLFDRYASFG